MNSRVTAICLLLVLGGAVHAQELMCEKVASYTIEASLDPDKKIISATQQLVWSNSTDQPVSELHFHAYWNAFKNIHSTYFREALQGLARGSRDIADRPEESWGSLEIENITGACAPVFPETGLEDIVFFQPDDDNEHDETVFKIILPAAAPPSSQVVLNFDFTAKIPTRVVRTGYWGDFFFIAHWFPKIGVLEEDGWNCHQFHVNSEFFADFGDYRVSIDLPSDYVVGATGVLVDSIVDKGGRTSWIFQEECVHDFAWTAYPGYRVAQRTFDDPELPQVNMRLLYQPEHQKAVSRFFDATANTLRHYGRWYFPYPYPQITIVDAPWRSAAAGMEYPTLFTTTSSWLVPRDVLEPEHLTVHECGHQFWYGIIANNEFEHAWLDEGFNSYSDTRCMNAAYGDDTYSIRFLSRKGFGIPYSLSEVVIDQRTRNRVRFRQALGLDPMNRAAWQFINGASYGHNAYEKPALLLWTLEGVLGEDLFAEVIKTYAQRYAFKHPDPEDFFSVVSQMSPLPLETFLDQIWRTASVLDYSVEKVKSELLRGKQGIYGRGEAAEFEQAQPEETLYRSTVMFRRPGGLILPVDVRITFEDGEVIDEKWDGKDLWKSYTFDRATPVMCAEIDPERLLVLDANFENNTLYRKKDIWAALRWSVTWMHWLQHLFEVAAFFS